MNGNKHGIGSVIIVSAFALIGLLTVCLTAILITNRDPGAYLAFSGPIVASLVSLIVISYQVAGVKSDVTETKQTVEKVEKQTNGALAAQFDDLKKHVTEAVSNDG